MSNYAQLLKHMLNFLDIKFIVLANTLGYDISYISKWCNGTKIPSLKSVSTIHKQMSTLFANEVVTNKKASLFFVEFNLDYSEEKDNIQEIKFLEETILTLLNKTYYLENPVLEIGEKNEIDFIFGKNDVIYFLDEKLKKIFQKTTSSKLEFFLTADFMLANLEPILSLISNLKRKGTTIYVSLGIDLKQLEVSSDKKLKKVFYLLNKYADLNIEFYNNINFKNLNILLLKNEIAFQYSLNRAGDFQAITVIEKKNILNDISTSILTSFKEKDRIWQLANTKKLHKEGYRTIFYTSDFFNFFLVQGFEFLLPSSIIDNIAKHAKKEKYSEQDLISILKVKIAWEEIFENSSINFFILKSSMFEYLEKGKLTYMNIHYQASIEERQAHYEHAIKILEKNPNIHLYIIEDDIFNKSNLTYNIGIFGNCKKMFFKNYHNLNEKTEPYFTIVNDQRVLNHINSLFDNISKSEYCKEYSVEELKNSWNKYSNMFFRLTEITEN